MLVIFSSVFFFQYRLPPISPLASRTLYLDYAYGASSGECPPVASPTSLLRVKLDNRGSLSSGHTQHTLSRHRCIPFVFETKSGFAEAVHGGRNPGQAGHKVPPHGQHAGGHVLGQHEARRGVRRRR